MPRIKYTGLADKPGDVLFAIANYRVLISLPAGRKTIYNVGERTAQGVIYYQARYLLSVARGCHLSHGLKLNSHLYGMYTF